jgi:cytochrome P450
MESIPGGPSSRIPGALLLRFRRDPIKFLMSAARQYGDMVHFKVGRRDAYLVVHPDLIQEVLVTQSRNFVKREGKGRSRRGEGLITTASDFSLRHRPVASSSFHREQLEGYAHIISECYIQESERWRDGAVLNVHQAMLRLTLLIIGKTLFHENLEPEAQNIGHAMNEFLEFFSRSTMPLADLVERLPLSSNRRFRDARNDLNSVINRMIRSARSQGPNPESLLSRLAGAESDGKPLSDMQIRDEALTILLAGHETTGNALTWTWFLLSKHPEVERRLHQEVDEVLGGRMPTAEDLQNLVYTGMVFNESLRLYPPAWIMMRQARQDSKLGDYDIPKNSLVLISQYVTHHDPRFFPDPERFDPDRWTKERRATLPRFAFFPFGGGPRTCIGEPLARLEGALLIASISQKWKFVAPHGVRATPLPHITLRPKEGLAMRLERR